MPGEREQQQEETRGRRQGAAARLLFPVVVIAVVAALGVLLWKAGNQVQQLDSRLRSSESRGEALDKALSQAMERLELQSERASVAEQKADQLSAAKTQAEMEQERLRSEREVAAAAAERARLETAEARGELDALRKKREAELNRMQEALSRIAITRRTPSGMVMELTDDSFKFDFDKAVLRPENRELLSRIAGVLLASEGYRLFIYGHTDDVGTDQYNQGLSERRARSVSDYLTNAGIPAEIITVKGFGKSNPRVKATTREAREKNRRVEIGIVDTIISYGGEVRDM